MSHEPNIQRISPLHTVVTTRSNCFHMFHYTLSDNNANVKVVATDPYGNNFTESVIIGDTDFSKSSN